MPKKNKLKNLVKDRLQATESKRQRAKLKKETANPQDELNKGSRPIRYPTELLHTTEGKTKEQIIAERGYRIREKLGAGSFATVYKAVKVAQNLVVACKIIDTRAKKRQRFNDLKHEVYVLEKVKHENVVKLYEHFMIDDFVYIFLEFESGGTVSDFVRRKGPLTENKAKQMFRDIASGIYHMHINGIAHRDIKLGNILMNDKEQCKVTDFGLSRLSYSKNKGITFCNKYSGTEPYMAPEIICLRFKTGEELKKWIFDPMIADIWALGICLFAMVNKAYPFNPDDKELMLMNQLLRKWKLVKKVRQALSEEAKDLLRHLLEPNVKMRITFLGIVGHPWLNTDAGEKTDKATQLTKK